MGVPQGGALSQLLFQVTLIDMEEELRHTCNGVEVDWAGIALKIWCLLFVDDVMVAADSPQDLQRMMNVVAKWANRLRIRFNIGVAKSAIMPWGRGRMQRHCESLDFRLQGRIVPWTKRYKYVGLVLSVGGSWSGQLDHMQQKAVRKTAELVQWCTHFEIPLSRSEPLWKLYVETAAMFGAGVLTLTETQLERLDRIQRKAGRLLMGHKSTSPTPTIQSELGWMPWSRRIVAERARLLARFALQDEGYAKTLLAMTTSV